MADLTRLTEELTSFGITDLNTPPTPEAWQSCLHWMAKCLDDRHLAHTLFEQTNDAIIHIGLDGQILRANAVAIRMMGASNREQIVGHSGYEFYLPSELPAVKERQRRVRAGEKMAPYHRLIQRKDGTVVVAEVNIQLVRDEIGNPLYVQSLVRDITEQQNMQDALAASEEQAIRFRNRLKELNEISLVLASADTLDDLLRQAVVLGRERLELDRVGIWLTTDEPGKLAGAYGTDEAGNLRDERFGFIYTDPAFLDNQDNPIRYLVDTDLYDHQQNPVGRGWSMDVLIRDVSKPVGLFCVDNLLRQEPFSPELLELLNLYCATLGHLITRKKAELALRASETRYRQMFEQHQLPKLIVNPRSGHIVDANPSAADYYGYPIPVMRTMNIMDISLSPLEEVQFKMAKAQVSKMLTCRFVHRDAHHQPREVEIFTGPIEWNGEELLYSVVTDVTEKEQVKAALVESINQLGQRVRERTAELEEERSLLRTVMDSLPAFIYVKDLQHRTVLSNASHLRLMKAEFPQDVYGKTDFELFPPAIAERFQAEDDALFAAQMPITNREECFTRSNGSLRWLSTTKVPLYNTHQELIGLVGISHDITERKRTEAEHMALSERLQLATETAQIGIWDWDLNTDKLDWDDRMLAIYGLTREEVNGKGADIWQAARIHPQDQERLMGEWMDAVMGKHPLDAEYRILRKDGSVRHSKLRAAIFHNANGVPARMMGVNWDITLLKQASEEMQQALKRESELSELKSRFVSMASHEFRTPLAAILATTETLTIYRDKMQPAQVDERLDRIRQHVLHMTSIITDVLNLAQIQAGRMKFEPAPGDVNGLCQIIIEELESHAEYRGRIVYDAPKMPVQAEFDKRLLRHIISNLGNNALKYSPNGKPVTIRLMQTDYNFTLEVQDAGIGIPPQDLARLYEPFHRASNVGVISGTGLGLSISKQAVELHGGIINVKSQPEAGTTFTITLPKYAWQQAVVG
jgi:PAS domain S-box-containing protein